MALVCLSLNIGYILHLTMWPVGGSHEGHLPFAFSLPLASSSALLEEFELLRH